MRKNTVRFVTLITHVVCLLNTSHIVADDSVNNSHMLDAAFEIQAYPTGVISGIKIEKGYNSKHAVHLRIGVQSIKHEDYGEHDDERGDGYGFTIGYRYYRNPGFTGWSFSARTDLWFNSLDWRDDIGQPNERRGHTDVVVLQPTVEIAYRQALGNDYFITPTVALGAEVNIDTDGEDTGEGVIWLFGLEAGKRF